MQSLCGVPDVSSYRKRKAVASRSIRRVRWLNVMISLCRPFCMSTKSSMLRYIFEEQFVYRASLLIALYIIIHRWYYFTDVQFIHSDFRIMTDKMYICLLYFVGPFSRRCNSRRLDWRDPRKPCLSSLPLRVQQNWSGPLYFLVSDLYLEEGLLHQGAYWILLKLDGALIYGSA